MTLVEDSQSSKHHHHNHLKNLLHVHSHFPVIEHHSFFKA